MAFYNNDSVPDLEGEVWKEIELIDHSVKDYFISNFGRIKSRFRREFFARKTAKRERLLKWVKNKKGESFTVKDAQQYIFHSTKAHLLKLYFKEEEQKVI